MIYRLTKLPVMFVLLIALLMYLVDVSGIGIRVNLPYQAGLSVAIFLFGLGVIALGGYIFRKANTTISPMEPDKASQLVTAGIYRLSRNPMYIGFLLWLLACAVFIGNAVNLVFLPLFIIIVNILFILPEEKALDRLFGDEFTAYKNRVRRWL